MKNWKNCQRAEWEKFVRPKWMVEVNPRPPSVLVKSYR